MVFYTEELKVLNNLDGYYSSKDKLLEIIFDSNKLKLTSTLKVASNKGIFIFTGDINFQNSTYEQTITDHKNKIIAHSVSPFSYRFSNNLILNYLNRKEELSIFANQLTSINTVQNDYILCEVFDKITFDVYFTILADNLLGSKVI